METTNAVEQVREVATRAVHSGVVVLVRDVERCQAVGEGHVVLIPSLDRQHECGPNCELQRAISAVQS